MAGNKPDVTLKMKPVSGRDAKELPVAAFWRKDGKMSGGWDTKLAEVTFRYEDGTTVVVKRSGKYMDFFLNLKDWGGSKPAGNDFGGGRTFDRDEEF